MTTSCPVFAQSLRSLWLLLFVFAVSCPVAQAQGVCSEDRLSAANDSYIIGRFDETFQLLRPCTPKGFREQTQRIGAYRLLALTYMATDSLDHARFWVAQILDEDSRYRPDARTDPLLFSQMVSDLKPRWYTWFWRGNEWYKWAGRSVIVGGLAALPFVINKDETPKLPVAPALPTQ